MNNKDKSSDQVGLSTSSSEGKADRSGDTIDLGGDFHFNTINLTCESSIMLGAQKTVSC